jgi:hypothetical protein
MDIETRWTDGLTVRSSNALLGHGFTSRDEVLGAFKRNEIHCNNSGGGSTVENLGKKGIAEVRGWLGLLSKDSPPAKGTLEWAISYCEDHGYTVTPNVKDEAQATGAAR